MQCDQTRIQTTHEGSRFDRRRKPVHPLSLTPTIDPIRRFEPRRKGRNNRLHAAAA